MILADIKSLVSMFALFYRCTNAQTHKKTQETVQTFFPSEGGENAASTPDMKHSLSCSRTLQRDSHLLVLLATSDWEKKACCAFSPPVSVSGARTAPATGPPTPAAVHPAPRG